MENITPSNIEELKKLANCKSSWRERLRAVKILSKYDCQQSRDILTRLAIHDPVFKVKEAAVHATQMLKITKNGKAIYLGKKPKGNLVKDINKKLLKVREALPEEFTIEEFKNKFSIIYPEVYDLYEGDKEKRFDKWLQGVISALPRKKQD